MSHPLTEDGTNPDFARDAASAPQSIPAKIMILVLLYPWKVEGMQPEVGWGKPPHMMAYIHSFCNLLLLILLLVCVQHCTGAVDRLGGCQGVEGGPLVQEAFLLHRRIGWVSLPP